MSWGFFSGLGIGFALGWQLMALRMIRIIRRRQMLRRDAPIYPEDV